MIDLYYHSTDEGFCRIYFRGQKSGTEIRAALRNRMPLYCLQQDHTPEKAAKLGVDEFALYRCSRDGEPEYPVPLERIGTIWQEAPTDSRLEKDLRRFMQERQKK